MGFLHHLAGLALGTAPASAARPALPPRFAALPVAGPSPMLPESGPAAPASAEPSGRPVASRGPQAAPTQTVAHETSPGAAAAPRVPAPPAELHPDSPAPSPRERTLPPPPPPAASIVTVGDRRAPPPQPPASPGELHGASSPAEASPATTPVAVEVRPPPETPVSRAAPLSAAAVAARAVAAVRDPAPVIHVTIDRLDVRTSARAEPVRSRPRPQPTVSLSDYLRDGTSRGRR